MIFSEPFYYLLLLISLFAFYIFPSARSWILTFSGVVFYSYFASSNLELVWVLMTISFVACWLKLGQRQLSIIVIIVALLIFFKFSHYLLGNIEKNFAVLLPLGFSYLAFEMISFILDSKKMKHKPKWIDLFAFAFFAPTRIAGPLKRFLSFQDEVKNARFQWEHLYTGFLRILSGLAKKYILADGLQLIVNQYSRDKAPGLSPFFAYSFYLYFDFSAYSDLAIGSARLFGIKIPENFNYPYLKSNIRDFWNAWHISLSQWLRDYVFLFLGKKLLSTKLKSHPLFAAGFSYLITFAICGLWHGSEWHYLLWGIYHGSLLSLHHCYRQLMPSRWLNSVWYRSWWIKTPCTIFTFLLVTLGWAFFAYDMKNACNLLQGLFS